MTGDSAPAADEPVRVRQGTTTARVLRRGVRAFGRFWWDFLVGDTPELLVGGVVAVSAAALLVHAASVGAVADVALPALVVGVLTLSTWRARSRGSSPGPGPRSG